MRFPRRAGIVALIAGVTAVSGCGSSDSSTDDGSAPLVGVAVAGQQISIEPTQYCLDDDGQRYSVSPPVLEVSDDQQITLQVPEEVAKTGWEVQVWDDQLEEKIGDVSVPMGTTTYDEITTSDVVPPTFYLVVVQTYTADRCGGNLSGAWPVGFIRGATSSSSSASTTSAAPSSAG